MKKIFVFLLLFAANTTFAQNLSALDEVVATEKAFTAMAAEKGIIRHLSNMPHRTVWFSQTSPLTSESFMENARQIRRYWRGHRISRAFLQPESLVLRPETSHFIRKEKPTRLRLLTSLRLFGSDSPTGNIALSLIPEFSTPNMKPKSRSKRLLRRTTQPKNQIRKAGGSWKTTLPIFL
ncbi:MAG: hypothetical protein M3209_03960 [Acidobacteriota bacterium]|nr:hypothetical protein [Acidobacteriota bacterium]